MQSSGFVVPFIEHRQVRLGIILKGPRILKATAKLLIGLISIFSCLRALGGLRRGRERGSSQLVELSEKHTYVSPKHFTVLALRFSSVIYFELFFVSGRVRVQLCSFACGDPVVCPSTIY